MRTTLSRVIESSERGGRYITPACVMDETVKVALAIALCFVCFSRDDQFVVKLNKLCPLKKMIFVDAL